MMVAPWRNGIPGWSYVGARSIGLVWSDFNCLLDIRSSSEGGINYRAP